MDYVQLSSIDTRTREQTIIFSDLTPTTINIMFISLMLLNKNCLGEKLPVCDHRLVDRRW